MATFTNAFPFNFTQRKAGGESEFINLQRKIIDLFARGEIKINKFMKESRLMDGLREKFQRFCEQNNELDIAEESIENINKSKRLKRRKWFVIIAEALLSFTAIKFFFAETVNLNLAFLPTAFLGIVLAYALLELSIEFRIDDVNKESSENPSGMMDFIQRYSYLISLIIIPTLNVFVIMSTPDTMMRALYLFFAIVSFLLNLKATSYFREYRVLSNSQKANLRYKAFEKKINAQQKTLDRISEQMTELKHMIEKEALNFRIIYIAIKTKKPELVLPTKYIFILNDKIYQMEVLEIPPLTFRKLPEGELKNSTEQWDIVFSTYGSAAKNDVKEEPTELPSAKEEIPDNSENSTQNEIPDANIFKNNQEETDRHDPSKRMSNSEEANTNKVNDERPDTNNSSEQDGGFGTPISDNEKYV